VLVANWSWAALPLAAQANQLYQAASGLVVLLLVVRLINAGLERLLAAVANRLGEAAGLDRIADLLPMLRGATWLLGLLVYLQNQGLKLTAVLGALAGAGLGIGLALRVPARDFFSYLTILVEQPFQLGQLLRFDDVMGRVVKVGLRSTHLRSLDGELVVINNAQLLAKTLRNYGDQQERRVLQRLLLRLDSGAEQLTDYLFYKHAITHQFCKTCGTEAFALGKSPQGEMRAINLRCVPAIDIEALTIQKIDGASF
jgi:small-conductance mechanosensitive channel